MQWYESKSNARTKIATALVAPFLLPLALVGSPVLLHEWWMGRGPAWWHWLRGEHPLARADCK